MHANPFLVLPGSVRTNRRSPVIAEWVAQLGRAATGEAFEVVDLGGLGLTLTDETAVAARGVYAAQATRDWSARVTAAAGVVVVTPQYNWGYPAALKNAIDHLYREWADKPVLIVTYGGHGGGKCAAQLREVFTGVHARLADAAPGLKLSRERIEADDGLVEPETDFAAHRAEVVEALNAFVALAA